MATGRTTQPFIQAPRALDLSQIALAFENTRELIGILRRDLTALSTSVSQDQTQAQLAQLNSRINTLNQQVARLQAEIQGGDASEEGESFEISDVSLGDLDAVAKRVSGLELAPAPEVTRADFDALLRRVAALEMES